MAHEFAGALQQAGRIWQRRAVKEPYVYVRGEYIDVAEGRIPKTCNRTAVMQELPEFVPTPSHHLKPLMRDGSPIWGPLLANAGTHEVSGDLITIHPLAAKVPVVMKPGANEVYRFRIEGKTLTLKQVRNARGVTVDLAPTLKFVRVE